MLVKALAFEERRSEKKNGPGLFISARVALAKFYIDAPSRKNRCVEMSDAKIFKDFAALLKKGQIESE